MTALERAAAALDADPDGELPLGARQAVWATLERRRRAELAIASCERVLGLWEGGREAREVLGLARAVLAGEADRDAARAAAGRLWTRTDHLIQLAGDPARALVGYACAHAVGVALDDEDFDPADLDPERTDAQRDPFGVDAAALAAAAAAGGRPANPASDAEARRAFWTWWLGEAARRAHL